MNVNNLKRRELSCFVACAFGKDDVDSIYNFCIINVLKELNIKALRVDKITFIGKIDTKILNLIKKSDFCIADLTYARPSVYYEAGYSEGLNKNVIYTAREDHFRHTKNDVFGNCKIHFDLITQNIIQWKKPNKQFISKLKKTVISVSAPIRKDLHERIEFSNISTLQKIKNIRSYSQVEFKKYNIILSESNKDGDILLNKKKNVLYFNIFDNSINKGIIEKIYPFSRYNFVNQLYYENILRKYIDLTQCNFILNSIKPIRSSTLESVLLHCSKGKNRYYYIDQNNKVEYNFYIIDDIKSMTDYKSKIKNIVFSNIKNKR